MKFEVGQIYRERIVINAALVEQFAEFSGDRNPIHFDISFARMYGFHRPIVHGAILVTVLSRLIGTKLPGSGAVWLRQSVQWPTPVFVGDEVDLILTVTGFSAAVGVLELSIVASNQKGEIVMDGTGQVKVAEKIGKSVSSREKDAGVVLVTGGGRGIGSSISKRLAEAGWRVAINYLKSSQTAKSLVAEIRSQGGQASEFQGDISDPNAARQLVEQGKAAFGRLDAVVHCATPPLTRVSVSDLTFIEAESYLKTYLGGALALIAAALPGMKERHSGRFVFLGTSALFGLPPAGWAAYISAKSALAGLVTCAAAELGPLGITVNMVSPSLTVTDLTADISPRAKEVEARRSPMRRLATPGDTADVVAFLLSDAAEYINGINLPLTGGPI